MTDKPMFPAKLAAALVKVSGEVRQLGKSEKNTFSNYDFVSVDKFYAALGPIMSQHGVHCIPDCVDSEVTVNQKTGKPLLREKWAFVLIHESGDMAGPFHRVVTVPAEGAQAHGSSESYAQKQFLRGVFRVPTGDKDDADYQKAEAHTESVPQQTKAPTVHPENLLTWDDFLEDVPVTQLNAAQSRPLYKTLETAMRMAQTDAELCQWAHDNAEQILRLNDTARHYLREGFDKLKKELM